MADPKGSRDGPSSQLAEVARFAGHGLTLAMAVLAFFLLGWWVDGLLGTRPLLAIVGSMLGAFGGFYSLYQHLVLMNRDAGGTPSRGPEPPGDSEAGDGRNDRTEGRP